MIIIQKNNLPSILRSVRLFFLYTLCIWIAYNWKNSVTKWPSANKNASTQTGSLVNNTVLKLWLILVVTVIVFRCIVLRTCWYQYTIGCNEMLNITQIIANHHIQVNKDTERKSLGILCKWKLAILLIDWFIII